MFTNAPAEMVGFTSKWTALKQSDECSSQTSEVRVDDKACQSMSSNPSEAQTEEVVQSFKGITYDDKRLASFLNRVTPSLIRELDKVVRSKAFSTYLHTDEDPPKPVKKLYTLYSPNHLPHLEYVKVSCLAWSCTGNVLAIGFQAPYHSFWCTHSSSVHFYNINKEGFDESTPSRVVETDSCVTRIAMHPYEPSALAIAFHDGTVELWHSDNPPLRIIRHGDTVTQISWLYGVSSQLQLVTAGLDGHMHLFKISTSVGEVNKIESYAMREERMSPQSGVTCFAFAPKIPGVFVAALEGGALLNCSTASASPTGSAMKDPVLRPLCRQTGPVSAIEFSPYIDDMFAVATVADKFTLYSLNETSPLSVIWSDFEVIGLCWSVTRAHALFAWGNAGHVSMFDSQTGREIEPLKPPDDSEPGPHEKVFIPSATVNQKSPALFAIGTSTGEAKIFELPPHLI